MQAAPCCLPQPYYGFRFTRSESDRDRSKVTFSEEVEPQVMWPGLRLILGRRGEAA